MKILHNILLICFAFTTLILHSIASAKSLEAEYNLQHNQSSISQPQELFFNALNLKENGYLAQALARLSEAYGEENIATDSYYDLLEKKRKIILKEIESGAPWFPGDSGSKKDLQSVKKQFSTLQSSTDVFISPLPYKVTEFPRERFINYKIVQTIQKNNARDCLNSPDPWMVSTILFLARKKKEMISPQDVIRRWESRPDLWDDVTEDQALLYLATYPMHVIHNLKIHNDDVRDVIQRSFKEKDNPLLFQCTFNIDRDNKIVFLDTSIVETEPYESLKRVEISLRDKNGKEFFRAMNNRMDHPAPIPPNAFGVYPVDTKKVLTDSDIINAGHEAATLVKEKYGNLVEGCKTSTAQGILKIHWLVKVDDGDFLDHNIYPFVKIIPQGEKDAPWNFCSSSIDNPQSAQPIKTRLATVTPLLCFKENACQAVDKIILVRLSRQKRKGIIKIWAEDRAFEYEFKEVSRKAIVIKKLPGHTLLLEPGFYRFEYNDVTGNPSVGLYGKSEIFEAKAGYKMKIHMWMMSAI